MIRQARYEEAENIQNLIRLFSEHGKVLFRPLEEIRRNISDFIVYEKDGMVVGVCSLNSSWEKLVEIRSLGVDPRYFRQGIGTALVRAGLDRALHGRGEIAFVLTYAVDLFRKLGFEVVEKNNLPQKVWTDCQGCLHRDNCDEIAMILPLSAYQASRTVEPAVDFEATR